MTVKKEFPTQARLHELLERHYDSDGRLYFVAKVKRGKKVKVGDVLYGYENLSHKGRPPKDKRFYLCIDGYLQQIAVWNYIYEYGDYDRDLFTLDHEDRNPMNDHHENLRLLTLSQQNNNKNAYKRTNSSSNFFGVYLSSDSNRWRASCYDNNSKKIQIGSYSDELEAAIAYDEASWEFHRDIGKLNFPEKYISTT